MHRPYFWATASGSFGVTLRYDQSSDSYEWHLVSPTGCTGIDPSVLVEFSEFRGPNPLCRRPPAQVSARRYEVCR